jgi:hypothetical protein
VGGEKWDGRIGRGIYIWRTIMVLYIVRYGRLRIVGARRNPKGEVVVKGSRIVVYGREGR